jgi:hypothetical protein
VSEAGIIELKLRLVVVVLLTDVSLLITKKGKQELSDRGSATSISNNIQFSFIMSDNSGLL